MYDHNNSSIRCFCANQKHCSQIKQLQNKVTTHLYQAVQYNSFTMNEVRTLHEAKQKIMCVSCVIMKKIKIGRSDLTFYF